MKARYWSLAIVLILINYLIFAALFTRLLNADFNQGFATRTPIPTFTPAPAEPPIIVIPTRTPTPAIPTPTATRVLSIPGDEAGNAPGAEHNGAPLPEGQIGDGPHLVAPGAVNIRAGPGVNYAVIGTLNANTPMPIIGRNPESSWWQIKITNGAEGWVADSVVATNHTQDVPIANISAAPVSQAPAPQPVAAAPPPPPEQPGYQYEPTGWYDDTNSGLTRFMGDIKDVNGNPVNGVFVQASCGDYSTISFPSGPVGWGTYQESSDWPAGFYDIVVDEKPVPCIWVLTVVDTDDRKFVKAILSESIPVEITNEKSVVVASWRKNW